MCTYYTDIDECLDDNGMCSHKCVNTEGSYHCECPLGYVLQSNKQDCEGCMFMHVINIELDYDQSHKIATQ